MDPFYTMDATEQAELIRRKDVSAIELIDAAIQRIETLNPKLNAVIHPNFEYARDLAKSNRLPDGPFKGVPYLIKDLSGQKGQPFEYGSRLFKGYKAKLDNGSVKTAKAAGLIILGKTTTPELGLVATTESIATGATRNPWHLDHHTGGSSGGSAAAVASGMVPFAQADDGGGSIRIPASACGVVGLKPSRGRHVAIMGEEAILDADILCRLGVTRSVRDTAQLLNISERKGWLAPHRPVGFVSGPSNQRLKIAYSISNGPNGDLADPCVQAAIEKTAELCASLGHEVVEDRPHIDTEEFTEHFMGIWASTPYKLAKFARIIGLSQGKWISPKDSLEPFTLGLANWFKQHEQRKPGVIKRSLDYFNRIERQFNTFFSMYDVHLSPVLRTPPIKLGEQSPNIAFDTLYERMIHYAAYTPMHNATGTPAISLPLFTSASGLPIGSQFAAGQGHERKLLELAYELEAALPWKDRWPDISAAIG